MKHATLLSPPILRQAKVCALALCLLLAACSIERRDDRTRVADTGALPTDTAAALTGDDAVVARWRERLADGLLHRAGACPFECCTYGDWAIASETKVRTAPRPAAPISFTLSGNQHFDADSGFVRITKIQLVVLQDTVDQRPKGALFLPGDTLVILDAVGEGRFNLVRKGRVIQVQGFWGAESPKRVAQMIGQYEREWWTHVTTVDGRKGWILIEEGTDITGADKCGMP